MALTNFNIEPYNDDFDVNKNFYKILFKPSYSVQARELTQIQSILQQQVTHLGEHIFKDGSMVIPGSITINREYEYVRLRSFTTSTVTDLIGSVVRGMVTGIEATIVNAVEAEGVDPATIFVQYKKQSDVEDDSNERVNRFEQDEVLIGVSSNNTTIACQVEAQHLNDFLLVCGRGSSVEIEEGVYFINGYFVRNNKQTLILEKYFSFPSYKVGFLVQQSFLNSFNDASLNDNATGTSNLNAPGADRYSISVTLVKKELDDSNLTDFVQLIEMVNGVEETVLNKSEYNILEDTLADRTYDESGNYVVKNFDIDIREHLNSGTNRGVYFADSNQKYETVFTQEQSEALLSIQMSGGTAYVKGYRCELTNPKFITLSKAREILVQNNSYTRLNIDNSLTVTNSYGTPDLGNATNVEAYRELILYKEATETRSVANTGSGTSYNEIGRAKSRFYEYQSGTIGGTSLFTGNGDGGSTYTLGSSVTDGFDLTVKINGTLQSETTDYTVSGTTLTFVTATPSNTDTIEVKQHTDIYKLGMFDIKFFTHVIVGAPTFLANSPAYTLNPGKKLIGISSGATGIIESNTTTSATNPGTFILSNVSGSFQVDETVEDDEGNRFQTTAVNNYSIKDIKQIYMSGNVPFTADVVLNSNNEAVLSGTEYACPIFKLPQNVVKTLKTDDNDNLVDTSHKIRRTYSQTLTAGGAATFTALADEQFDSFSATDFMLSIISTANDYSGDIVDLSGLLSYNPSNTSVTVNLGSDYGGLQVKFVATITKNTATEKTKALVNVDLNITALENATSNVISLGKADVFRINSIYMANGFGSNATNTDIDVTDRFILDDGQRESFYDLGRIIKKPSATAITGSLRVNFDYFTHGSGSHFSVDSYTGDIDYSEIPVFNSVTKGKLYLRDCIDFRPRVSDNSNVIGYDGDASNAKDFTNNTASAVEVPKPGSDFICDLEYYIARVDTIGMNIHGQFKIARGEASLDPQKPEIVSDMMPLYHLYLPPYTFKTSDIKITPVDNRRFTMRDIGKLEQRIKNLEYYTQLSLLEQSAINTQIPDSSGLDRFKNGILVDSFKGHNISDVTSIDNLCSIDMVESELRPSFSQQLIELEETQTTDEGRNRLGYAKTGDLITLPYTHEKLAENLFASKSVNCNPYMVFQYVGTIFLDPDIDEWRDVNRRPDLIVNNNNLFDTFSDFSVNNTLGTVWNDWQTSWSGSSTTNPFSGQLDVNTVISRSTETSTRTGSTRELTGSTVQSSSFGDKVIDTSFITFIRERTINFRGARLKPNTRVYAFFDNIDVSAYCTPTGGTLGGDLITNNSGEITGTFAIPNTDTVRFRTGDRVFRLTSSQNNSLASAVTNDEITTFAEATYTARGLLTTNEQSVQSTRVPVITTRSSTETQSRTTIDNVSVNASANAILNSISNIQDATNRNRDSINLNAANINNLNAAAAANAAAINANAAAIQANTVNAENLASQLSDAQGDIGALSTLVGNVQNTVAIQGAALSDVSSAVTSVQADVNNLEGMVANVGAQVAAQGTAFQNQINSLAQQNNNIQSQINQTNNRITTLERFVYRDPLAQTFFVDKSGGCFVTKVDLYFRKKDSTIPIEIYMTSTLTGRPTTTILPFSRVVVNPSDINVSEDATAVTTVSFPSPVYLQPNKEYAIVLRPDSQEYEVWVSRLGQNKIGTTDRITQQPLLGSFFRSQNSTLWTEDQYEDLTFTLYNASFTQSTFGNVDFQNVSNPVYKLNNISVFTNDTAGNGTYFGENPSILKVIHKNHGMNSAKPSKVYITGFEVGVDYNGIDGAAINSDYEVNGVPNGYYDVDNVTLDSYTIKLNLVNNPAAAATATGAIGTSQVTATEDINFQILQPQIGEMVYDSTKVNHLIRTTSARSIDGIENPYVLESSYSSIVPNDNFYFTTNRTVLSDVNEEIYLSGNKSLLYRISLVSFNKNLSPVIDTKRTNLFAISNRINIPSANLSDPLDTFVDETAGQGGSAAAKYITKEILLSNPSTAIDLRLSASIFSSSSVEVYHKTKGPEDSRLLIEIPFVKFDALNSPPFSEDRSQSPYNENYKKDFSEYRFSADGLQEFTSFQIKIVMKGNNPAYPPRITDLRAIALAL